MPAREPVLGPEALCHARKLLVSAQAVLFDLDGTLIETRIDFGFMRREVLRLAAEAGTDPLPPVELDILAMVQAAREQLRSSVGEAAAQAYEKLALERLEEIEREQSANPARIPGAREIVDALHRAGIAVGVVTRNSRAVAEKLLADGDLTCCVLLTRDDVARTKPDPHHLLRALELLSERCRSPERISAADAVMVGDHWMDMKAGIAAGCATIGLLRGRSPDFFAPAEPDVLVEELQDLLDDHGCPSQSMTRRTLFAMGGASLLADAAIPDDLRTVQRRSRDRGTGDTPMTYEDVPSYCSHEHWGSIASFGMEPEGFRPDVVPGATPTRRTGLMDLILDPYFHGWLAGSGFSAQDVAKAAGVSDLLTATGRDLERAWGEMQAHLCVHLATGTFQAIRRGIRRLYGTDIQHVRDVVALDDGIAVAYTDLFGWYERGMQKANLRWVIRPVHPEYYYRDGSPAHVSAEAKLIRTVLRIDPLLQFWKPHSPRREALARDVGVDPADAASWRRFLDVIVEKAAQAGAVGIKQLQAYTRSLDYEPRADASIRFRGDLTSVEVKAFQDWVVHECCKRAHDRRWPHQIHVGTHNLPHSSPLPLADLAARYRSMPIVQLHCWPYLREAGWLAWLHPNVYTDTCWLPVLNPAYLHEALDGWIGLVPAHKIMCGHDATSMEMAVGSSMAVRQVLHDVLSRRVEDGILTERQARDVAEGCLHGNAARLYGWPASDA